MRSTFRTSVIVIVLGGWLATAAPGFAGEETGVTYYEHVLPILQESCQTCHRPSGLNITGLVAPMPLMTYEDTRPWARAIARKVEAREMPPWFASAPTGVFSNERRLSDAEIETIVAWVDAGAPAGDKAAAPERRVFPEEINDGWTLGKPDFVVKMEPYLVADDVYDLNISFRTKLTEDEVPEDVWVRGWEFRAGNNGDRVHHFCTGVILPGEDVAPVSPGGDDEASIRSSLGCMAAGAESTMLPEGFGLLVPKGSTVTFGMHYNKEPGPGTAFRNQAEMGFFVAKAPPKHVVKYARIANEGFEIPPHHPNYHVGSAWTLEKDIALLTLWPHAHFRGKAARLTATYPDGREELLLDVPRWDQGWQVTYKYREPKVLPKGTRIDVHWWFDNSAARAARYGLNPDRAVGDGPRTNDEMQRGFFTYAEVASESVSSTEQRN